MSTFLQLTRKLRQECEIAAASNNIPAAVTGQTGQLKRVVDWTASAWDDIQRRHTNWRWMRRGFTLPTVAGTASYAYTSATDTDASAAISRFGHWWAHDLEDPFRCYLTSGGVSGEYRLSYMPWEGFKWIYGIGTQNQGKPAYVSVDHLNKLHIGPKPDAIYTISGDFQRSAQTLAADGDEPEMPSQFHDLIVYWAMEKYGANSIAQEIFARGRMEANRLMRALEANQLPALELAPPLA